MSQCHDYITPGAVGMGLGGSGVRRGHGSLIFSPLFNTVNFSHLSLKGSDTVQGGQGSVGLIWRAVGRGLGMIFQ